MKFKISLIVLISMIITACATGPLQAPCDQQAHFCGSKTKINHW